MAGMPLFLPEAQLSGYGDVSGPVMPGQEPLPPIVPLGENDGTDRSIPSITDASRIASTVSFYQNRVNDLASDEAIQQYLPADFASKGAGSQAALRAYAEQRLNSDRSAAARNLASAAARQRQIDPQAKAATPTQQRTLANADVMKAVYGVDISPTEARQRRLPVLPDSPDDSPEVAAAKAALRTGSTSGSGSGGGGQLAQARFELSQARAQATQIQRDAQNQLAQGRLDLQAMNDSLIAQGKTVTEANQIVGRQLMALNQDYKDKADYAYKFVEAPYQHYQTLMEQEYGHNITEQLGQGTFDRGVYGTDIGSVNQQLAQARQFAEKMATFAVAQNKTIMPAGTTAEMVKAIKAWAQRYNVPLPSDWNPQAAASEAPVTPEEAAQRAFDQYMHMSAKYAPHDVQRPALAPAPPAPTITPYGGAIAQGAIEPPAELPDTSTAGILSTAQDIGNYTYGMAPPSAGSTEDVGPNGYPASWDAGSEPPPMPSFATDDGSQDQQQDEEPEE